MKKMIIILLMSFSFLLAVKPAFNEYKAFDLLVSQVDFGPRYPGSPGQITCRDWIIDLCDDYADTVIIQEFQAYRPDNKTFTKAYNIIARFSPEKQTRVMLSAHWDTRPISDMDRPNYSTPVPGANDGASGTAVLLELLRHVKNLGMESGLDLIFWDAEDMGIAGNGAYFCQGSEFYSYNPVLPKAQKGILIDMIGDHALSLPIEVNSMKYAPQLVQEVYAIGQALGYSHIYQQRMGIELFDDHVPLNTIAKIPTIDLIDFSYTYQGKNLWHTPKDLPRYCSPNSLKAVGDVLLLWLSQQ